MANNAELIKQCEERAQQWLAPAFDEETRNEVKAMLEAEDKSALLMLSIRTWSLVLVACAVSWVQEPTV